MEHELIEKKRRLDIIRSVLTNLSFNTTSLGLDKKYFKNDKDLNTFSLKIRGKEAIFRIGFGKIFSEAIDKEIYLYKEPKIQKYLPELIRSGGNGTYSWLLYKKIKGRLGGNVYQFNQKTDIGLIADSIIDLQKRSTLIGESGKISEFSSKSWLKLIQTIIDKNSDLAKKKIIREIIKSLNFLLPRYKVLSHGDLHPANIILTSPVLKIIDWEGAKINSPAFDLSFLWLRASEPSRGIILSKMFQIYPDIEKEAQNIFIINALRDSFEWSLVAENRNKLLSKENTINGANANKMAEDSLKMLENIYKHGLVSQLGANI